MLKKLFFLFVIFLSCDFAFAQSNAIIYGTVSDSTNRKITDANVIVIDQHINTITDEEGKFEIKVPANKSVEIAITYVGRTPKRINVRPLASGEKYLLDVKMDYGMNLKEVQVTEERDRDKVSMQTINPKNVSTLPNVSGSFEQILKTLPGVSSNNELSSQYNVRGGNYDENLIYVNDIEIYRPFLPRSGQQEGLSFIHSELVDNIKFSAGGFEAKYGDKMSSVLDIKYKDPSKFASSVNVSLLGVQAHVEGASKNKRFTYLLGTRYWSNQYVVSTLDVQGDYKPSFTDVQTLITYHLSSTLSLSFLGSYAQNKYLMIPQTQETTFGTVKSAIRLTIYFDGQDLMEYRTATGAVSLNYKPNYRTQLKLYSSAFYSNENEYYTIEGAYRLEDVETDMGSQNFGKSKASLGVGDYLTSARNQVEGIVYNVGHKGSFIIGPNNFQWGAQAQAEQIKDILHEWYYNDSLGFAQPTNVNGTFVMNQFVSSSNTVNSFRVSGFLQNAMLIQKSSNMIITYGLRSNWWSYNNENVVSPRIQFSFEPNRRNNRAILFGGEKGKVKKDLILKAAFGYYYQPPFYREMRGFDGTLNPNIKAQRAIHYVLGGDMNFKAWDRPFKFFAEAYYKQLDNLIPYEIDNVRIRYFADNIATGYATGVDFRVNGEFVKGTESWASLSILQTQERIPGAIIYDANGSQISSPGYVPRPTDQRVNASIMFQDYLPKFPSYRMYLNMVYGSGLPFGPPIHNRYADTLQMPFYFRVDIGFMKSIIDDKTKNKTGWKRHFKSMMIGAEVFNLLARNNTISYIWLEDIEGRRWAVPNYLTGRRLNLKLMMKF
ncbi:MAG: carboxypeptidase-like regulatory domain-containing protein [Bacteroidota bacterium]